MPGTNFWRCLEELRGQAAVTAVWQRRLGEEFESIRQMFLRSRPERAESVPCPHGCGCRHEVVLEGSALVGICQCETWNCDDVELTPADITVWELHWRKLARAVARALGLEPRFLELGTPGTVQVGLWSAEAVPVLLSICSEARQFRSSVAELVTRLGRPFILLAPTGAHLDASSQEMLAHRGAALFPLESCCRLSDGSIEPVRAPGELFAKFAPGPVSDPDEDLARRAVALVQKMENPIRAKPPGLARVFRLYCLDSLSAAEIAKKCDCSKTTVMSRLDELRKRLGMDPVRLRRVSGHLARLEEAASDSRARRIRRRDLIDDPAREE